MMHSVYSLGAEVLRRYWSIKMTATWDRPKVQKATSLSSSCRAGHSLTCTWPAPPSPPASCQIWPHTLSNALPPPASTTLPGHIRHRCHCRYCSRCSPHCPHPQPGCSSSAPLDPSQNQPSAHSSPPPAYSSLPSPTPLSPLSTRAPPSARCPAPSATHPSPSSTSASSALASALSPSQDHPPRSQHPPRTFSDPLHPLPRPPPSSTAAAQPARAADLDVLADSVCWLRRGSVFLGRRWARGLCGWWWGCGESRLLRRGKASLIGLVEGVCNVGRFIRFRNGERNTRGCWGVEWRSVGTEDLSRFLGSERVSGSVQVCIYCLWSAWYAKKVTQFERILKSQIFCGFVRRDNLMRKNLGNRDVGRRGPFIWVTDCAEQRVAMLLNGHRSRHTLHIEIGTMVHVSWFSKQQ